MQDSEERFSDLLAQGHSEAEALGLVIQQFGSFDDIRKQLGVGAIDADLVAKRQAMAEEYKVFRKRFTVAIVIGVVLGILAVVLGGVASAFSDGEVLTILGFFLPVTSAAAIFVYFGIHNARYMNYFRANKMYDYLDEESYEKARLLDQESLDNSFGKTGPTRAERERSERISGALWVMAVAVFLSLGFIGGWWHPGWLVFVAAVAIQMFIL